jgi:hypothetical protein
VTVTRRADGTLDLFLRGGDLGGWHMYAGQHGTPGSWEPLAGVLLGDPVGVWTGTTLQVFAIGADHSIWRTAWNFGWSGSWGRLGGISDSLTTEHVTASPRTDGTMDLFVAGADGAAWHAPTDATGTPQFWESLGGSVLGAPWAAWGQQNQLDVLAVGTDSRPWGLEYTSQWSGWRPLPGGGLVG